MSMIRFNNEISQIPYLFSSPSLLSLSTFTSSCCITRHTAQERVKFNFNSNPHTTQQRSLVLRFGILMTTLPSFRWALCHWFQISSIQHRLTESRGWSCHGDKCTNSTDYFGNQSPSLKQSMRYEEERVRECGYKFLFFWQNLADFSQW